MSQTITRDAQDGFDLGITTVESAPRAADLLNNTDHGCGHTPDSAGVVCFS
jgi:FxLD family lantipeptide